MTQAIPALLLVEGEKLDVHSAGTLVDRRRDPQYVAGVKDDDVRLVCDLVLAIGATHNMHDSFIHLAFTGTKPNLNTFLFQRAFCL